ncbi:MAG: MotA/TolQ/ExbB proton channel family protein [Betaproteobacteria bacterium]|nr:MotA/TolQ/ExbB proton channel family protein [Betaproteobacteria bacterium]
MGLADFCLHSDAFSLFLALLLLGLSVASWVVIVWKWRLLLRVQRDVTRSVALFWQASSLHAAREQLPAFDRERCVLALVEATEQPMLGTLAGAGLRHEQLTRTLRDALREVSRRLQWGQVVLATAGSTAPFVGLLGTVWGIFNALTGMAEAGQLTVDKIAGPVGEALVMTAFGLGVAIPAVLGYNLLGRRIAHIEAELEGFAHDLRGLLAGRD